MEVRTQRAPARLTWIAVALGGALCALGATIGADARWLAAVGSEITRRGGIPAHVPYAAAPSVGWHDAPVLGQLIFHGLESLLGDRGLILAQVAAVLSALALIAVDMRRAETRDGFRAVVLVATFVAAPTAFWVVRAQLFSLALFPLLVLLLRSDARRPSGRLWLAVPLLALWANLHGACLLGFAVLAVYVVLRRLREAPATAVSILAASALALLATPALLGTARYYLSVLTGEAPARHFGLWAPLSLHQPFDLVLVFVTVPLLAAALRARPAAWELAVLALLAVASVHAARNGVWLVYFVATPACRGMMRTSKSAFALSCRSALVCGFAIAAVLVVGLARTPPSSAAGEPLLRTAAAAAQETPILADPLDAEKLALERNRVWIGNPLDAFARQDQALYLDWLRGEPAGDAILRQPIRVALVMLGSTAQRRLASDRGFREIGRDGHAALYLRR
jgi:hypothetical protein